MKFTCERCGKRFASVDEPSSGRVYRIKCKCGNVIHITAPHVDDAAKRAGGLPPLDRPRITGATTTSVPASRPPISAGDATSRVHLGAPPATRVSDPAFQRRTTPGTGTPAVTRTTTGSPGQPPAAAPRTGGERTTAGSPTAGVTTPPDTDRSSSGIRGGVPRTSSGAHPLATPVGDLGLDTEGLPPELELLEPLTPTPAAVPPAPLPAPAPVRTSSSPGFPLPGAAAPLRSPFETTAEVPAQRPFPDPRVEAMPVAPPADDPFAAAAAHAARANLFDTTAPVATRGPTSPVGGAPRTAEESDESIDLSISEQYALPKPGKKRSALRIGILAGALVVSAAAAAVYHLRPWSEPRAPQAAPVVPRPPGVPSPLAGTPPQPVQPAAAGAPREPPPAPTPQPAAAPPPPAVAARPPEPPPPAAKPPEPPPTPRVAAKPPEPPAPKVVAKPPPPPAPKVAAKPPEPPPPPPPKAVPPPRGPPKKIASTVVVKEPAPAPPPPVAKEAPRAAAPPPPPPPQPAPAAAPPPVAAAPEPPPAPRKATQGLDPAVMQAVIARNRPSFDVCVERALQDPTTASFAGRKAALLLLIAPTGKAEAALEDADLDASPFGACLRRVAAKMAFPAFQGDDVGARIVLVLGKLN